MRFRIYSDSYRYQGADILNFSFRLTMEAAKNSRTRKVKNILIAQEVPEGAVSPYVRLIEKFDVKIDFRPFVQVKPVGAKEFRKQKIDILKHSAVILTSRNAVNHFFRLCDELNIEIPADMKYFCVSVQTSNYLQKYVTRKRKIFTGSRPPRQLTALIKKHKTEKYLFPCSEVYRSPIPTFLKENGFSYSEAFIYKTVSADLCDLVHTDYDMIALFSPSSVDSLMMSFPDFDQKETRIATFGTSTAKAVRDAGLTLDVEAPQPNAPSMIGALEHYISEVNGMG